MQVKQIGYTASSKLAASPNTGASIAKWMWWMWVFATVVAFSVQAITLDVLPHLQQDEAQITDYGRLALHPTSNWSVTWWMAEGKPLLLWSYIGPLIAEFSYQVGGASGLGPRFASLVGGIGAATVTLGWLLSRRVPVYAAFGLSFAFMLDPLFVLSQRMARVDSWVVALCIGSCWLLHNQVNNEESAATRRHLMVAGSLAAAAALVWPSAVFLYPLITLELIRPRASERIFQRTWWQYVIPRVLYFVGGGLISLLALLLPVWQNMAIILQDMSNMVAQNVNASKTLLDWVFVLFDYQVWFKLIKALVKTFTPLLPLLAIAGMLLHRGRGLILVTAITVALIFSSLVYEFRVLYLLPYFVVLSSGIFIKLTESPTKDKLSRPWLKRASTLALAGLVAWSVGTSLIARTALGLKGKSERGRDHFQKLASSSIGAGNHKVFLGFTYEFYFVGRSLGWQLYTPYIQFTYDRDGNWLRENDYKPKHQFIKLLSQMDYAIFSKGSINEELAQALNSSGLHYSTTLQVGNAPSASTENSKMESVFMWFLEGKKSYSSYVLYAREQHVVSLN